ncbi:uncharacterized protein LOC115070102 [Nannospalax galili]|uniref:uncharacterized protein LOC115070102 n=1 Tax=Nannospalax galili TaxID=1026970 RepID=UPI00111C36AF|nr:uncharacterized protein LOC115070102 [Nannospalax galili]XP_029418679.1 uncharacterized protein LOC115070102 [Nannospalax galili]
MRQEINRCSIGHLPPVISTIGNCKQPNSQKPQDLIDLLESVLFTHQPTWDNIQQLLQVLFTTKERDWVQTEAHKLVPRVDGNPTTNQALINEAFPLARQNRAFNVAEGKARLWIYRQTLMEGLWATARCPTNLAKISNVQQEKTESLAAFLERILEAFHPYTPMNPKAPENKNAVVLAFVNQSVHDIRHKLQKLDRLADRTLLELLAVAERVYNHKERLEDKQALAAATASTKKTRDFAKILLAMTARSPDEWERQLCYLSAD